MNKGLLDIRPWILPIALLIIWEVVVRLHIVSASLFPSPISILTTGWELVVRGELTKHISGSLNRYVSGLLNGGVIDFVLGIINGIDDDSLELLDSAIQLSRTVQHLDLLPVVVV